MAKDIVVIGGGIGGLTAGMFASRLGLDTVLLEQLMPGGQIINAEKIENFPGILEDISGADLASIVQTQAMKYGTEIILSEVSNILRSNEDWIVSSDQGDITTQSIIIAGGSTFKKLGVKGEEELYGAGVSNCATCDGAFFIDQDVCVIGGGDSALDEALTLTEFAKCVYLLVRDSDLKGQKILQDRVLENDRIQPRFNVEVTEIHGDTAVEAVSLRDTVSKEHSTMSVDGVFIFIGLKPNSDYLSHVVDLDPAGHIYTDYSLRTKSAGIFAAGDIRKNSASQLITSAADGATAALTAFQYLRTRQWLFED